MIKVGDYVFKVKGYNFAGEVMAVYEVEPNSWRCDVKMVGTGMLHIFDVNQVAICDNSHYLIIELAMSNANKALSHQRELWMKEQIEQARKHSEK